MGKHLSAVYSPRLFGLDTFEYIRYSFPEFVHTTADRPGEWRLYTRGFWLDPHPAGGGPAQTGGGDLPEGLIIRSLLSDERILAVADVALPGTDAPNVSFVLTNKGEVYAQAYSANTLLNEYESVFDQDWGAVTPPPQFLELAAFVDTGNAEIHAITLVGDARGNGLIFDWFGPLPFGTDLGSWTVVAFLFTSIPGGRLVAASYSHSLQEREILVATTDTITLIRNTKHSTRQEDFASFPGATIISLTSFSVPDDTAERAVVATTSDNVTFQLWEIAYESSVGQPLLIGTLTSIDPLAEISGYANPTEPLRHLAMLTAGRALYRGSYTQSGGGFQYSPWPGVPAAVGD